MKTAELFENLDKMLDDYASWPKELADHLEHSIKDSRVPVQIIRDPPRDVKNEKELFIQVGFGTYDPTIQKTFNDPYPTKESSVIVAKAADHFSKEMAKGPGVLGVGTASRVRWFKVANNDPEMTRKVFAALKKIPNITFKMNK